MSGVMEYKGYYSRPRYSAEDKTFWGKLDGISDSVSFEGASVSELQTAFIEAVDDYLDTCQRNCMSPKFPFMGHIELTVSPETHKQISVFAESRDLSMSQVVETAIVSYLSRAT